MTRISIFVSSAIHELEYEREVAEKLIIELGMEPVLFEGLPPMSKVLSNAYLDEVKNCDFFVLILWKTFSEAVEQEYIEAVNNNKPTLIFIKMLGKNEFREEKLSRFIGELERINSHQALFIPFYKEYRRLDHFSQLLKEGLIKELERKLYATPITTHTREEMYELGTEIIESARKRLYIVQRTPSLIFGSRPYHDDQKLQYEAHFVSALEDWIEKTVQNKDRHCIYLFCPENTKEEMEKKEMQIKVKRGIEAFKEKEKRSEYRFRFSSLQGRFSGPIAIGDNRVALWIMGEDNAVSVSFINIRVSDEIVKILKQQASGLKSTETLFHELGLY